MKGEMDLEQWEPQLKMALARHGAQLTPADREDMWQECFLALLQAEEAIARVTPQGRDSVEKYVYRIASNACVDMLRVKEKDKRIVDPHYRDRSVDLMPTGDFLGLAAPDTLLEGVDKRACQELYRIADFGVSNADLEIALSDLEPGEQFVLRSLFFNGESERDIGKSMKKSQTWVRNRKDSGLKKLKEALSWKKG